MRGAAFPGARSGPQRRTRFLAGLVAAGLHCLVLVALIRGFAPPIFHLPNTAALTAISTQPNAPAPKPPPRQAGGASPARSRDPSPQKPALQPPVPITLVAQPVASAGDNALSPGAGMAGAGLDQGRGDGKGNGVGQGAGQGAQKLSGDIRASDYPEASQPLRIGDYVIVALTVGTDGRVQACRIHRPSRDPQADAITCNLARSRFRFRPATDAGGNPVEAEFGWRQSWHY